MESAAIHAGESFRGGDGTQRAVCSVNMKPSCIFRRDLRDFRQWIDGAGVYSAGRGDDRNWCDTLRSSRRSHCSLEFRRNHAERIVDGNQAQLSRPMPNKS